MLEYLGWSVVDQMSPFYAIAVCVFIQRQVKIQCVQHQWSRRLFWEMQENRGTKRGGVIVWGAVSQSYVGLLHMTHDLWLTEWSRLHGYLYRWFVGLFSPYARLWGQLLLPGRQCSLLQSCYCFWFWFYWMFYDHFSARSLLAKLGRWGWWWGWGWLARKARRH